LLRLPWIASVRWRIAILDETQAIKNPGAKQAQAAKRINAASRIVLAGSPVENRLADLWSIFDYLNPGLPGSNKAFAAYARRLEAGGHFRPLRELTRPYILRRLKTDKTVIADLPDKREITFACSCPDWAAMCKHVAAVLYGVGARLDAQPELLFTLRRVDAADLITHADDALPAIGKGAGMAKRLDRSKIASVFGIELADAVAPAAAPRVTRAPRSTGKPARKHDGPKRP
jgi:hypothetical protein